MTDIKCALWNCSGILSSSSAQDKLDFLASKFDGSWDILVLVESHHRRLADIHHSLHTLSNKFRLIHTEASGDDPYAGIVVLINKKYDVLQQNVLIPGRLLNFEIGTSKHKYNFTAVYGHTGHDVSRSKLSTFVDELARCHRVGDRNILLGDFNFVENDLDRVSSSRVGMNQSDRLLGPLWVQFLSDMRLSDAFRAKNPRRRMFSYIHTAHGAKSRIDRVYSSDTFVNNLVFYRHTLTPFVKAHKIVTFSVREGIDRGPGFWKMNTSVIPDRVYGMIIESTIQDVLNLDIEDPIERWLIFIETVRIETQVYCTRKRRLELRIVSTCEKRIAELEQDPMLSQCDSLGEEYAYCTARLNDWTWSRIDGYRTRIRAHPRFEAGEPNVAFFADLEKKRANKKIVSELRDGSGKIVHTTDGLKQLATEYYTDLFSVKRTDRVATEALLGNIKDTLSPSQREFLDALLTHEELEKAVMGLQRGKSPGPDGIPAEFYQYFWEKIKHIYMDFITAVGASCFPDSKNSSVTSLIYKDRGESYLLSNYRPIALMNVDVKILTKLLSMRLLVVLPSIIHETQTAVYGRRIDNNVNLVRDLIDLANKDGEDAALLFLDQEKAFDRVNHGVLFRTMERFGFGTGFIKWIEIIYSNASTCVDVNGFFTDSIRLNSGVRQGCPLSPLLYVLVIELLALRLRSNPNIVGFTVGSERIISSHYSDDAVIKITQNRCFKEVYKDLCLYSSGTGATINYDKTKGLWVGGWRGRADDPFESLYADSTKRITWTSGNVRYLGVYVGNDDPALVTFTEIVPKIKRRLNYWKPLALPVLSKARVVEIFHASKLWYAASFYPIPGYLQSELDDAFLDYIKFPKNKIEVCRMEMEKERAFGGIKLINIGLKSVTPKIHWLIRLVTDRDLRTHYNIFCSLVGEQKGGLVGKDLLFTETIYVDRHLRCDSRFYFEALRGISRLDTWKHVPDINQEHLFFNRVFSTVDGTDDLNERTLLPFRGNRVLCGIRTYGDLLSAENTLTQPRLLAVVRRVIASIAYIRPSVPDDEVLGHNAVALKFGDITQKFIYSQLVCGKSTDHIYQTKWHMEHDDLAALVWDEIWEGVHQQFFTEEVKSTVWDQIHLNFYTTYNYNKWHNSLHPCPLCGRIPDDVYHVLLDCRFTKLMWQKIGRSLMRIIPVAPDKYEMAFGLRPRCGRERDATILRNWLTFSLRHQIMREERRAYYFPRYLSHHTRAFIKAFNHGVRRELFLKSLQYSFRGLQAEFERISTLNNAIGVKVGDEFIWSDVI